MKSDISTNIGIFCLKLVARIPFWLIYILSDLFYLIVYYVVGYRKKVVAANLRKSFPEKNGQEIKAISKIFFRHFCDITLETIKTRGMGEKDFRERMVFENADFVNNYFEKGKSVVVLTMHYNNWEWTGSFPLYLKHKILAVYKPLHNAQFDRYMNSNREKFGIEMVQNSLILRRILKAKKKQEPVFTWLAGDQTPPFFHKFWMIFLNQEAMFYPGPASISKQFDHPVFFQHIKKTGRGKYATRFELLFENPAQLSDSEIMHGYIQKMEEIIREEPEYYLWSHKRWKHKRPADVPMQG